MPHATALKGLTSYCQLEDRQKRPAARPFYKTSDGAALGIQTKTAFKQRSTCLFQYDTTITIAQAASEIEVISSC